MDRRTFLALVSGVTSGVAGCHATGGSERSSDSATSTPPGTPRSTPPMDTGGLDTFELADIYEHVEMGSRTGVDGDIDEHVEVGSRIGVVDAFRPHDLHIWNTTPDHRVINLRILDRLANTTVHRAAYTIPADKGIEVTLLEPARYFVQLWGPVIATETLRVPCSLFDCNESVTGIRIPDDGHLRPTVTSTLAGCPSADC